MEYCTELCHINKKVETLDIYLLSKHLTCNFISFFRNHSVKCSNFIKNGIICCTVVFITCEHTELTVVGALSSAWPSLFTDLKGPAPSDALSACGHENISKSNDMSKSVPNNHPDTDYFNTCMWASAIQLQLLRVHTLLSEQKQYLNSITVSGTQSWRNGKELPKCRCFGGYKVKTRSLVSQLNGKSVRTGWIAWSGPIWLAKFQNHSLNNYHEQLPRNTYTPVQVTTYLSCLTVFVDLRQAGRLFRSSEGLKLTEVCEIGLLRNLLGGGGGERCPAPWHGLCLHTMPGVWYGRLWRGAQRLYIPDPDCCLNWVTCTYII